MKAKSKQDNWYQVFDSCGRPQNEYFFGSNLKEAMQKFKNSDTHKKNYYWTIKRVYNGGARG